MKKLISLISLLLCLLFLLSACKTTADDDDSKKKKPSKKPASSDVEDDEDEDEDEDWEEEEEDCEDWEEDEDDFEVDEEFYGEYPENGQWVNDLRPEFEWTDIGDADSYTLILRCYNNGAFRQIKIYDNLTDTKHKIDFDLKENELYSYVVIAYRDDKTYVSDGELVGIPFVAKWNYQTHPANKGLNFTFSKETPMTEEVLNNYMSRSSTCHLFDTDAGFGNVQENLRMLFYTGTKYVSRAVANDIFMAQPDDIDYYPLYTKWINFAHEYDPEIIFEGGVYEALHTGVNAIEIPDWVFEAFDLPVEKGRTFNLEKMMYDVWIVDPNGDGIYNPDMSKLETQMWFYFRGVQQIDAGFEALHLGSAPCMSDNDAKQGFKGWKRLCDLLHEYAKTHARRSWVILNAHNLHNMYSTDSEGNIELFFDYNPWTLSPYVPEYETDGSPEIGNPQEVLIGTQGLSLFGRTQKGRHPLGYYTEAQIGVAELDNYGEMPDIKDKAQTNGLGGYPWGYCDAAWFALQPDDYRRYWVKYALNRSLESPTPNYYINIPLCRTAGTPYWLYQANIPEFGYTIKGRGDEEALRDARISHLAKTLEKRAASK